MIKRLLFSVFATVLCQMAIAQSISSNSPLCSDSSPTLELKASGGTTYFWSGPSSFTSNQQNPTINKATSSNSGTYSCLIDGKSVLSTTVKVGKNNNNFFYAYGYTSGARLYIYSYGELDSGNNSTLSYSWKGPNNFSSTERFNTINAFDKKNQGTYTVTIKDEFGCVYTASTQIAFSNQDCPYTPTIYVGSKSGGRSGWDGSNSTYTVKVCEGTNVIYSTDTTNWGKNVTLQWFKDDKIIPNATALEYSTKDIGTYYVQISKGTCAYSSIKLKPEFSNITPVINLDNVAGKPRSEKFICKKGGSAYLYYYNSETFIAEEQAVSQWYKDGVAISKGIYSDLNATEAGIYQVKVKRGQCEAVSEPVSIKSVDQIKPIFTFYANDYLSENQRILKLCNENTNSVQLIIGGDGDKKIYKNGVLFTQTSSTNTSYSIFQQPGIYTLETKQGECKSNDTLRLEYGKTTDFFTKKYEYQTCTNAANFYYNVNNSLTPYNYVKWYKNDALFSSGSSLFPNTSGNYQGKFENTSTGCKAETEKFAVTIPSTPSRQYYKITSPTSKKITICKNLKERRAIFLNDYRTTGVWKRNGKDFDTRPNAYNTYVTEAGKYWYEYNSGQCITYSDTLEVVEEELPKITLTQTCIKDNSVKLNVNASSGVKYNWFQNGIALNAKDTTLTVSQGGKYVVETYRNGCFASSNDVNVGVSVPEIFNICNGDSLKLKANSDVLPSFSWTGPNNFKSNLQNPIVAKTNKSIQGFYKLSASDKAGCSFVAQTQVIVNDYPAFTVPKLITICAGSDFVFNQLVSLPLTDTTESVSYYYVIAPNKSSSYGFPILNNVSSKDAGVYNLTVLGNQGGCPAKTTTELVVDASASCKSISLASTTNTSNVCQEQTVDIPFRTTGTFKDGTIFRAFYEETLNTSTGVKIKKTVLGTSKQSPIKVSNLKSGFGYNVKVESDDGVISGKTQNVYTIPVNNNAISDGLGYGRNAECTSLPLTVSNYYSYSNVQWFLNGDTLKKETTNNTNALKTGIYTFKAKELNGCQVSFSKDIVIGKLIKPTLLNYSNELSCFNESVYLGISQQYPTAKFTWRRDGVLQTETYSSLNATIAGKYTVEISKETCKAVSDTVIVKQSFDKNTILKINSYTNTDAKNEIQTYIYASGTGLGNSNYKFQVFKDNLLFAEGGNNAVPIKDAGKYFFKITKGDCEAVSDVIDFKSSSTVNPSLQRSFYYNGNYDFANGLVQLCDTNYVQYLYGYSPQYESGRIVDRKLTAYQDNKPLPVFKDGANVYPSLRVESNYFYLYFRGVGNYYVTEELTLSDSTKLKFKYGEMKVSLANPISIGSKIPQNIYSCADSVSFYGNYYSQGQRPITFTWKRDGVVVKKSSEVIYASNIVAKQNGIYTLETTFKGGCMAISNPYKVELNKLDIGIDTTTRLLCDGTTVTLSNTYYQGITSDTSKATGQISYQWLKDGKEYLTAKNILPNDIYRTIALPTKDAGVYALKLQQGKCQGTSANVMVKIDKVPNTLNYADSVLFCQTQSVNLKTNEDATLSYLWERDGGFLKDATKAILEVKEAGMYRSLNRKGACWNYTPKVRAKVLANILPTAILTGDKDINYADTAKVSIAFTSHAPWTFKLSDGKEYTATKSPLTVSLRPQFSTNYTLTEVKNVCGTGTVSGSANIKVLVLSSELEQGIDLNVFPVPSKEDVSIRLILDKPEAMEWTLNNTSGNILLSELQANKSNKHESVVSLKSLPEGVYFLRIQVGEKSLIRKIIKTN